MSILLAIRDKIPYRKTFSDLFSADIRSLALLRVCTALVILADLAIRCTDLTAHYSDTGVLPRLAHYELTHHQLISLHLLSGSPYVIGFLFALAAVFAVLMAVGYRTRLFTVLSWIMLVSLQNRNPMVLQGGDDLLRMVLFWAMFIPWGSYFSMDALSRSRQRPSSRYSVFSPGVVALMIQVGILYFSTFWQKSGPEWRSEFTAVYYALNVDQLALEPAYWFRQHPLLMKISTVIVVFLEGIAPVLLFFPYKSSWVRIITIPLLVGMHITFGLFLKIGLFPYIDAVVLLVFLPSLFWQQINKYFARFEAPLTTAHRPLLPEKSVRFRMEVAIVGLLLSGVAFWNVTTLHAEVKGPIWYESLMTTLRLDQNWGMFAPYPFRDDGWYVMPAKDRSGNEFDLFKQDATASVSWIKPLRASKTFKNYRWRKYMRNIYYAENERHRLYLGKCLCLDWNENHRYEEQLTDFTIYYRLEGTPSDRKQLPTYENRLLWTHQCFDEEPRTNLAEFAPQ